MEIINSSYAHMGNKALDKLDSYEQQFKVQCKNCGRKRIMPPSKNKIICDWCGAYIFKDEKAEFDYRMKQILKK